MKKNVDLFIIGGGIHGTAIAADAAGRGLSVILCEKKDLASGTSSASTKLIHGGLRYLEHNEFNLVRQSLQERAILIKRAPNITAPMSFIFPYLLPIRPAWLIRLGLFLYDHLTFKRFFPLSKSLKFENDPTLKPIIKKGFSYYDCVTDDARWVILNALSAQENQAVIYTQTAFLSAEREEKTWKVQLQNETIYAKCVINASGPWVQETHQLIQSTQQKFKIKLVKGSHIVVPRLYDENHAYLLEHRDKRVIFVIPFQQNFSLIGTTDLLFNHNADHVEISEEEKNYLCSIVNTYFQKQITPADIVWSYSGVRCLQAEENESPSSITRDYELLIEEEKNLPLVTLIGGKLTTHRVLAEKVLFRLKKFFPDMKAPWTAKKALPGCDFLPGTFTDFLQAFQLHYPFLPQKLAQRYATLYGKRAHEILTQVTSLNDLGIDFTEGLYQREVEFLIKHEWAKTVDDILWRRTKLGLYFSPVAAKNLETWLQNR